MSPELGTFVLDTHHLDCLITISTCALLISGSVLNLFISTLKKFPALGPGGKKSFQPWWSNKFNFQRLCDHLNPGPKSKTEINHSGSYGYTHRKIKVNGVQGKEDPVQLFPGKSKSKVFSSFNYLIFILHFLYI